MLKTTAITSFAGDTAHLVADYFDAVKFFDEVVVVDDGSSPATADALRTAVASRDNCVYVRHDRSYGFSKANNVGWARSSGDIVHFLNSDIRRDLVATDPAYALDVPADTLCGKNLSQQFVWGVYWPYLDGWCVAARRATWDKLVVPTCGGPWDSLAYPGPYWEDVDLTFRALCADIAVAARPNWPIKHLGGQTMGAAARHGESIERNRATFAARVRGEWLKMKAAAEAK